MSGEPDVADTASDDGWGDGGGWGDAGSEPDDATDSEPGTGDDDAADPEDAGDGPDAGASDDVVDAEIVDATGEPVPNDGGVGYATGREVEPRPMNAWEYGHRPVSHEGNQVVPRRLTDDPHAWGWGTPSPAEPTSSPRQGPNDGARPGAGSQGGMKGDGAGGGAGAGKRKITRKEKRAGFKGGGSGGGGGTHVSIFGGILTNASVVKTGSIGSGNAVVKGRTGSGHTGIHAGPMARAAKRRKGS